MQSINKYKNYKEDDFERVQTRNYLFMYTAASIILCISSIISGELYLLICGVVMMALAPVVCKSCSRFVAIVLSAYFVCDQIQFNFMGSTFKIYFIVSIILIFLHIKMAYRAITDNIIRNLTIWILAGIVLSLFSPNSSNALFTFCGVILQALSAYAIYLVLCSGEMNLEQLETTFYNIIKYALCFGYIQLIIYKISGIALGINPSVTLGQLAVGQVPSFFYEGNSYGKLLCWGIIFCIPGVVHAGSHQRKYIALLFFQVLMLIMSMTRTATYAMVVALVFLAAWYVAQRYSRSKFFKMIIACVALIALILGLVNSGIIQLDSYSSYKIENMFNISDLESDVSAAYRMKSMEQGITIWRSSIRNFLAGVGYGQATGDLTSIGGSSMAEVGGSDIFTVAVSFGVIGLALYIYLFVKTIMNCIRIKRYAIDETHLVWIERIFTWIIYFFAIGFMSGAMLRTEYWIVYGIAAYVLSDSYCDEYTYMNSGEQS